MITESTEQEEQWLYRINEQIFGPVSRRVLCERIASGKVSPEIQVARNQGEFHHISRVSIFREVLESRNQDLEARRRRIERIRLLMALVVLGGAAALAFHLVEQEVSNLRMQEQSQYESILKERESAFKKNQAIVLPGLEPLVTQEMLAKAQVEYDERMAVVQAKAKSSPGP